MKAQAINAVTVTQAQTLPDGVKVLITPCADCAGFKVLPKAVGMDGTKYGLTGWNSDSCVAYYRDDAPVAEVL